VARTSTYLALVALAQGKRNDAHRYLLGAFHEETLVSTPDSMDVAWMYSAECLLHEKDGDFKRALTSINRAIELWTQQYGPRYYLLALGYSMRGWIYHTLQKEPESADDLRHSLQVLADNSQADSETYFLTEIAYAKVLRSSGKNADASRIDAEARAALEDLHHKRCGGCTISAEALR
jgi:tetratricopeptide (TPR) repeat protein